MVGATGSSIVSYLLPGLCYFRLRQGHRVDHELLLLALMSDPASDTGGMLLRPLAVLGR